MRKFLLAFFTVAVLLSANGMTAVSDVQVILKSQNLGLDKNYGVYIVNITITMNKIGNLTYREYYYQTDFSSGSAGQQTLFRTSSYDIPMKDYTASFVVNRPGLKSERDSWNSIKAIVLLDKNIVFEVLMPGQSGTYKSFVTGKMVFTNDSTIQVGKTRPTIEKKPPPSFVPPSTTVTINDTGNVDTENTAKQSPMFETSVIIATIFSVYIFTRKNGKNNN